MIHQSKKYIVSGYIHYSLLCICVPLPDFPPSHCRAFSGFFHPKEHRQTYDLCTGNHTFKPFMLHNLESWIKKFCSWKSDLGNSMKFVLKSARWMFTWAFCCRTKASFSTCACNRSTFCLSSETSSVHLWDSSCSASCRPYLKQQAIPHRWLCKYCDFFSNAALLYI